MSDLERLTDALADRYTVERELGQGGMATVYLAHDLRHNRKVAVKVLRPELAAALGSDRFLREIEIAAGLSHPHILPLYDSGTAASPHEGAGEYLFYVMPYVEGESLRERLTREKQLPLDEALTLAREIADALSFAHARGVIHRDIKPENILLQGGHAVVADFGIARAVDAAGGQQLTETGLALGTPMYMSPEQAAGERDLDGRSDLYALGCVLYEMLAGQPPFSGPTVESVVHQHLTAVAPPITQIRPAVPAEVAGVLQRALAKNPADRFNPVAQFADALREPGGKGSAAATSRPRRGLLVGTAAIVVTVIAVTMAIVARSGSAPVPGVGRTVQVTREPGLEVDPAISPDGQMVAYASGTTSNMQIFVRQVAGGRTVQLTTDPSGNFRSPRWSPDGTRIAYQATDGVYVVPALGGAPRLVARAPTPAAAVSIGAYTPLAGLSWSPDGRRIVFAGNVGLTGLWIVDADGGEPIKLEVPLETDSPSWSPDGSRIAVSVGNSIFVFGTAYFGNAGQAAIWIVPVDGSEPVQLTDGRSLDLSPQWSPDGRFLYFVSDRGGSRDVYRIPADGRGEPQRVTTGLGAQTISLSPDGRHLAFTRLQSSTNIWAMPVPTDVPVTAATATPITTGTQTIESVDVTRDGRQLVFDSDRSGNADIYTMATAGGEAVQLTTDSAGDYSPAWSPDGTRIAFHSLRTGNRDLFIMNADGTGLTRLTSDPREELDPSWSPDGRAIVVEVMAATDFARENFVVVPLDPGADGGQTLTGVGDFAEWSPLGDVIAFHANDGIRLMGLERDSSRLLVSNAADGTEAFYSAWAPDGRTLFYLARGDAGWMIRAIPSAGGPSRIFVRFDDPARQPAGYGFTTDGRTFYLTMGAHEADVWVLDLEDR